MRLILLVFILSVKIGSSQTWQWAKKSIGADDEGVAVCTDVNGNAIMTGGFYGPTTNFGSYTLTNTATDTLSMDFFVVKYDPLGNVLWAKSAGGINDDMGMSVATDLAGNVFISGSFGSPTIVFGTYTLTNTNSSFGYGDIFVVKYDSNGNLLWVRQGMGNQDDEAYISTNPAGDVFIGGNFNSTSLTLGTYTLSGGAFIAKYDNNGNLQWAQNGIGSAYSVAADNSGNAYLTGTAGPGSAFGTYTVPLTSYGSFLIKYDPSGNVLWVDGSDNGFANCVSTNSLGNVFVGGRYSNSVVFGSYTLTTAITCTYSAFLTKYDSNGNAIWAKSTSGLGNQSSLSLSSKGGDIFYFGTFTGTNVAVGTNTFAAPSLYPTFFAQYDLGGNILYANVLGRSTGDDWAGIALDDFCNVYLCGDFYGGPLAFGTTTLNTTTSSSENTFLSKLAFNCQPLGIKETPNQSMNVSVFPNPSNGAFKVQTDNGKSKILLFNMLGQKVFEKSLYNGENNILVEDLSSGLYQYIIEFEEMQIANGKITIERN